MQNTPSEPAPTSFGPLHLADRSAALQVTAVLLGTLILTMSSYIVVPMVPVPMSMQTFAVTMVGALYGWRLGAITIVAWLMEGAAGLPVFASGGAGLAHLAGSTGGYLVAFPIIGALTGWLVERGWNGRRVGLAFIAMLVANMLCLVIGTAWLSALIGLEAAWAHGFVPFVLGAVLKSALGAASLKGITGGIRRPEA